MFAYLTALQFINNQPYRVIPHAEVKNIEKGTNYLVITANGGQTISIKAAKKIRQKSDLSTLLMKLQYE